MEWQKGSKGLPTAKFEASPSSQTALASSNQTTLTSPERTKYELERTPRGMDFVSDALVNKRKIRVLTIIDDCSREVLAAHADFSLPAQKVIDVLELIALARPYPKQIRIDNGPEFLADRFRQWRKDKGIAIHYIQPGKPMLNGRGGGPRCGKIESHLSRGCPRCLFI